ncbi:hypothetical protein BH23CHL7_BH23CHL7_11960 [soil metagenome]
MPSHTEPRTTIDKIWDEHVVLEDPGAPAMLGIDVHLVHEVTSPQAFDGLRRRGLTVGHPERTIATADHSTPTHDRGLPILDQQAAYQVAQLGRNCDEFGIPLYGSEVEMVLVTQTLQRMTICNMSIEGGARAGLIAPDETTFAYVDGRPSMRNRPSSTPRCSNR